MSSQSMTWSVYNSLSCQTSIFSYSYNNIALWRCTPIKFPHLPAHDSPFHVFCFWKGICCTQQEINSNYIRFDVPCACSKPPLSYKLCLCVPAGCGINPSFCTLLRTDGSPDRCFALLYFSPKDDPTHTDTRNCDPLLFSVLPQFLLLLLSWALFTLQPFLLPAP